MDLLLLSQSPILEDIHTFHVVLGQSGLARWAGTPYSYLAMTKPSPVLGLRVPARDLHLRPQVPLRLPPRQEARVVRAAARGAPADHGQPHRGRPPLPRDLDQHRLLLRPRRPGVRRLLRGRRARASSSTSSRSCGAPSRAPTRCATPRSSPAWRCRWAARSTRSTARPPPRWPPLPPSPATTLSRLAVIGTERTPAARRHRRLGPGRLLHGRARAQARGDARRGRHVRPAADALRAGALRRRAGPSEDQVGDPRLREDRGPPRVPLLRQRRGRQGRLGRRAPGALPRGRLRLRHRHRPPARHSGRGPARLAIRPPSSSTGTTPTPTSPTASSTSPASAWS